MRDKLRLFPQSCNSGIRGNYVMLQVNYSPDPTRHEPLIRADSSALTSALIISYQSTCACVYRWFINLTSAVVY